MFTSWEQQRIDPITSGDGRRQLMSVFTLAVANARQDDTEHFLGDEDDKVSEIDAEIDLCNSGDVYFLRARLNVSLPGLKREVAQAIVDTTHGETCAYSNATRGNIDTTVNVL
jgi:hypothetical protein